MGRKALVLGGGGVLGISWEIGLLAGLMEEGVDVTRSDLLFGTSAGSVVSTQIAQGRTLGQLLEDQMAAQPLQINGAMSQLDLPYLMQVLQKWASFPEMTEEACAAVGALALAAKTVPEEEFIASIADLVADEWPERDLRITSVDAESGKFRAWSRDDGVSMTRAVASSCAVPGMFPCITIDGHRYQDGGVRSGTSADLASGYETVLIVAPLGDGAEGIGPALGAQARREAEGLAKEGARVELVFPDAKASEATGVNRMDSSKRGVVAAAGVSQGRDLAALLKSAWSPVSSK
jgi:NTE family protein